MERLIMITA